VKLAGFTVSSLFYRVNKKDYSAASKLSASILVIFLKNPFVDVSRREEDGSNETGLSTLSTLFWALESIRAKVQVLNHFLVFTITYYTISTI